MAVAESLDIVHLMKRKPARCRAASSSASRSGARWSRSPLVFLLDEPFSNLDAGLRSRMRTEVKHLHLKLGTTSVFVTHDQEEAMTLSDLIAVMRDGKVVQLGHHARDLPQPDATSTSRRSSGKPKMSLVDGAIERSDGEVTFVSPDLRIALGSPARLGLHDGDWPNVALGVRAEDVRIRSTGATSSRSAASAPASSCSSRSGPTRSSSWPPAMPRSSPGSRRMSASRSASRSRRRLRQAGSISSTESEGTESSSERGGSTDDAGPGG